MLSSNFGKLKYIWADNSCLGEIILLSENFTLKLMKEKNSYVNQVYRQDLFE